MAALTGDRAWVTHLTGSMRILLFHLDRDTTAEAGVGRLMMCQARCSATSAVTIDDEVVDLL